MSLAVPLLDIPVQRATSVRTSIFTDSSSNYIPFNRKEEPRLQPQKQSFKFTCTWFEIFLATLCVSFVILGLCVGLTCFFLLTVKENNDAKNEFIADVSYNVYLIQKNVGTYIRILSSLQFYMQSQIQFDQDTNKYIHPSLNQFINYVNESV
jgi:hypothetical protein